MTWRRWDGATRWIVSGWAVVAALATIGALTLAGTFSTEPTGSRATSTRDLSTTAPTTSSTTTTTTTTVTTTSTVPRPASVVIPDGVAAPVFSRVPTGDPVVFFTVDDGMVQDPAVIDYLRDQHIPVTIFPVPAYVHQNPDYFQAIHALGASVQDHTLTHPNLQTLTVAGQQHEICGPLDEYTNRFGTRPWLFRPPYGNLTPSVPTLARGCGIRAVVLWRATMNDGVLRTQGGPLQPGDIILMHFRTDLRQNLDVALNAAHAQGLHPAPLEQYLTPK